MIFIMNNRGVSLISVVIGTALVSALIVGTLRFIQVSTKSLGISKSQFQSIELSKRILYALQEQGGANGKNACTNTLKDITLNNHGQDIQTIKKATATHSDSPTVLFKKGDEVLPSQITIRDLKFSGNRNQGTLEVFYSYKGFDIPNPHNIEVKVTDFEGNKLKSCELVGTGGNIGCEKRQVSWGGGCVANLVNPMKHGEVRQFNQTLVSYGYHGTSLVQCLDGAFNVVDSECQHKSRPRQNKKSSKKSSESWVSSNPIGATNPGTSNDWNP